jgi:hypothetical protein
MHGTSHMPPVFVQMLNRTASGRAPEGSCPPPEVQFIKPARSAYVLFARRATFCASHAGVQRAAVTAQAEYDAETSSSAAQRQRCRWNLVERTHSAGCNVRRASRSKTTAYGRRNGYKKRHVVKKAAAAQGAQR